MNVNFLLDSISHVSIGNGTVYNFIDYVGEMHLTGGLLNYTRNTRLLEYNLFNNFSNGTVGRYGYGRGQYLHNENMDSKEYYKVGKDESTVTKVALAQDRIGEQYTVPAGAKNSTLSFLGEPGFLTLADYIRNENLKYNIRTDIFKTRYGYYNPNAFIASGVSYPAEIGEYAVDTNFRKEYQRFVIARKTLKDNPTYKESAFVINTKMLESQGVDNSDYENYRQTHFEDFKTKLLYPNKKHKKLLESGEESREKLFKYLIKNESIENSKYKQDREVSFLEQIESLTDPNVFNVVKDSIIKSNEGFVLSSTVKRFTGKNGKAAYGIKSPEEPVFYSVYDKNKLGNRTQIDPSIKGGSFITRATVGAGKTYTYFNEPDGKQLTSIGKTNTFDNFTPVLMTDNEEKSVSKLLQKTNKLFKDNTIKSLVNRFHTETISNPSDVETAYSQYGMSRGRNLLKGSSDKSSGYDNPYCRVWTAHHQYSKLKNRIRPFTEGDNPIDIERIQKGLGPLRSYEGPRHFASHTVLQDNGLVRIGPTVGEKNGGIQNFMFSIENLAWKGHTHGLTKDQVGPNNGRIMWFPPYNLKFTENVNVQWQDNSFIGRGEKIYTYTNTERAGTLNFTLLMDHPSVIDAWRVQNQKDISSDANEETILRFFAGCAPIELKETEKPEEEQEVVSGYPEDDVVMSEDETYKYEFIIFFPNDFSGKDNVDKDIEKAKTILDHYESADNSTTSQRDHAFENEILIDSNIVNTNNFGLNTTAGFTANFGKISEMLSLNQDGHKFIAYDQMQTELNSLFASNTGASTQYKIEKIETFGHASSHGYEKNNLALSQRRQEFIAKLAKYLCSSISLEDIEKGETTTIQVDELSVVPNVNSLEAKIARCARLVISKKLATDANVPSESTNGGTATNGEQLDGNETVNDAQTNEITITATTETSTEIEYTEAPEYKYFSTLQNTDNLAYNRIVDKIRYFTPAFHSITPEGFNERLNFLHQCTRQGPTVGAVNSGEDIQDTNTQKMAANLAFGKAPYCVLRIGDFFHTKICIDSLSYSFESNGGVVWDLNPEGAGVQPMMAEVSINFKFLGGQDIGGVVDELQNAISENYYANSSVYNNRAKRENK